MYNHRDGHIVNDVLGRAKRQSRANATQKAVPLDLWSLATEGTQEMSAFSEFWRRLSQLDKFNICHWHSACKKFGGLDIIYTDIVFRFKEGTPVSVPTVLSDLS